jgi:hypothetical protein
MKERFPEDNKSCKTKSPNDKVINRALPTLTLIAVDTNQLLSQSYNQVQNSEARNRSQKEDCSTITCNPAR